MKKKNLFLFLSLILTLGLLFLSSCGGGPDEAGTLEDPKGIKYDCETNRVSWDYVKNADYYEVSFDDSEANKVKSNNVSFKSESGEFKFSITAKSDGLYKASNTVTRTFIKLDSDIQLTVSDEGEVSWNEVNGATAYEVYVDNKSVGKVITPSYNEIIPGAAHSVKVKPVKEAGEDTIFYSTFSSPVTITKLGEVPKESIKYENGEVKWNAVTGAAKYVVDINGQKYDATTNKLTYDAENSNFNVVIQAIGNHTTTFDGRESEQKKFVYLETVTNITVENGLLTWSEVENATSYQIKLKANTNQPVVSQTNTYSGLAAGTQYSVTVYPVGNDPEISYFANWSAPQSILILAAPDIKWTSGLEADGVDAVRAINWNIVQGATGYYFSVTEPDGSVVEGALASTTNYYEATFAEVGNYEVRVKAIADGSEGVFDSAYSDPVSVKRLPAPTITTDNITSTPNSLKAGFTVSFTAVNGATAYELYRGKGELTKIQTQKTSQFRVTDIFEEGKVREDSYAYYVRSIGSISPNMKNVVLSSRLAQDTDSSAFNITILATPESPTVTGKGYGAEYAFLGVANGYGYSINISGSSYDSATPSYSLDTLTVGSHEIKACAVGNGHEILASDFTTPINVTRINAPYNITIDCGDSDGLLKFDGAQKALSYQLVIDGREEALTVDTTTNMREYISTQGTILHMYSVANYFDDLQETQFIMTSPASTNQEFIKLEAPTAINFSNTDMNWNAPSNINASGGAFTPTYRIYDNLNQQHYDGEFAGRSFPLSDFDAGVYTFGVKAIGNGSKFINSEIANSRQIEKLATPQLRVNTTENRYEWKFVAGAVNYALVIDSKVVDNSLENYVDEVYTYIPTYETIGIHTVSLTAVGDGGTTTINSKPFEYLQTVAQLSTPTFKYSYSHDSVDVTDGVITMIVTQTSPNATGYVYNVGNADHLEVGADKTEFSINPKSASGEIALYMYAKGNGFDAEEVFYIDSQSTSTKKITLLSYPNMDQMPISTRGVFKWKEVVGASGYILEINMVTKEGVSYTYKGTITNTLQVVLSELAWVDGEGQTAEVLYSNMNSLNIKISAKGNLVKDELYADNRTVTSSETEYTK